MHQPRRTLQLWCGGRGRRLQPIFALFFFASMIKLPFRALGRLCFGRGFGGSRLVPGLRNGLRSGRITRLRFRGQIVRARPGFRLVQSHDVPQREKQTRKQNHSQEQPNDVTAFEYALTDAPMSSITHFLFLRSSQRLGPLVNNIDGQGKHNRCVLLDTYLRERLQISQLNGRWLRLQHFGGVGQLRGSFKFAVGVNDFRAALALGFRLPGDGALHLFGNVDLLDFYFGDFDAPGFGVLVQDYLELGVHFFALGEDFVQFKLADDAAQRGLRELRGGVLIVLHLRERRVGVDDAEITHGVHFDGDVVAGDDILRRNVERFKPKADAVQRFDRPHHQPYARSLGFRQQSAQPQHHAALPLFNDVNRIPEPDQHDSDDDRHPHESDFHAPLLQNTVLLRRRAGHFGRLDVQLQPLDFGYANHFSFWNRLRGLRAPKLAMNAHHSFRARFQFCGHNAIGSNHFFHPRRRLPFSRAQDQPRQNHGKNCEGHGCRQRYTDAHSARCQRRANQEQCAQKHRNDAAERQHAVTRGLGFQNEKRQRQRDEEQPGEIHREKMHVVQRQDQADSSDYAGRNNSGMRELRVQTERTENQQEKENIRLDDT